MRPDIRIAAAAVTALAVAAFTWLDDSGAKSVAAAASNEAAADLQKKRKPVGIKTACSRSSEADFPGAFTDRHNLVIGPLVLVGAARTPEYSEAFGGQKFQALVRNGHRVTFAIPRSARPAAGLAYGRLPTGEVTPPNAHRAVRFLACARSEDSASTADGRPVTFWTGGLLVRSPRCVPLRVWTDDRPPRDALIRLGVTRCG